MHRSFVMHRTQVVTDALRELAMGATLDIERVPRVLVGVCFLLRGPVFANGLVVAVNYHPEVKIFSNSSDGAIRKGHLVSAVGCVESGATAYVPAPVPLADMRVQHVFDLKRVIEERKNSFGQDFDADRVLRTLERRYFLKSLQ